MLENTKIAKNLAKNAKKLISDLGFADAKILFVSDEKIWKNSSQFFGDNFLQSNYKNLILNNVEADEKNLRKIANHLSNCNLIIGLGSGVISDLCKLTAAQKNIPYIIFPSAASMNGYLSKNASITISGYKKTLPATLPLAVFCDLDIIKNAPKKLTKAGIGDLMCFYNCWFDWYLSHQILNSEFDEKPFLLLQEKMEFFVKNFTKFSLQDDEFFKLIIEILLLSGYSMTIANGSYPASQAEHLIAHTIEMKYKKIIKEKLHGEIIAITTLVSSKMQKKIIKSDFLPNTKFTLEEEKLVLKNLKKFFGTKVANQCFEEYKAKNIAIKKVKRLPQNWLQIKQNLTKIYLDDTKLKQIFVHFKINSSPKFLKISDKMFKECVKNAKFIRNRFTCLDFLDLF